MKRLRIGLTAFLVALLTVCLSTVAAQEFTMKLAHAAAPGDPRDDGANLVAELLNSSETCEMEVQVYPASQLGGSNDLIQLLQLGSVEAALLPASFLVGFQPLLGLMDLPYFLPDDPQQLLQVHQSEAMDELLATTSSKGIVSLGVWHTGYKQWTGPRPLASLDDYRGVTVRAMPSQILVEQDRLLNLQPVGMDFAETYSALQNGAIDGQENPITTIYYMKFHEVQDYMTMTNHGTLDQVFMVSKSWWDRLPEGCQTALDEAVDEGAQVSFDRTYAIIETALEAFGRAGMETVELTADEKAALAEATRPARDYYVKLTGGEGQAYIDAFVAEMEKLEGSD